MNVILTQTDTTVGFLSQNVYALQQIKQRPSSKPFIKVYNSFKSFKNDAKRVPTLHKNRIRRSEKITYVVKNRAFRIAKSHLDSLLLTRDWFYSTSANETTKNFNRDFCELKADIIIENKESLHEKKASSLFILNSKKLRKIR